MMRNGNNLKPGSNKLRACLNCALIQTFEEFKTNGCPNCPFLMTSKDRNVNYTTSASFKGSVAAINPKASWVAKWQRISNYKPGMYAMIVEGELREDFIDLVEKDGRVYINRSKAFEIS